MLLLGLHCQGWLASTPEGLYKSIEQSFVSGRLAQADEQTRRTQSFVSQYSAEWIERFRLQRAKILLYQGRTEEAQRLLEEPSSAFSDSMAVVRATLLSVAYTRAGHLDLARKSLAEAERGTADESERAGVYIADGVIDVEHGELDAAGRSFTLALTSAEGANDSLQQAYALLNLGVVSLRKEHYEDALGLFKQGSDKAKSIGAGLVIEKAMGSEGWTYFKMGDYSRALANSQDAEREAETLGSPIDQVEWLNDMGLAHFKLGNLAQARSSYEQSLRLAKSIGNHEEIVDAQVALGYLDLESRDTKSSLAQAREAIAIASARMNEHGMFQPLLLEARALAQSGRLDEARAKLISLDQRTQSKPSVQWEVESTAAQLFGQAGDAAAANQWFERAISTFNRQRSSFHKVESLLPFSENASDVYVGYMEQLIREGRPNEALAVIDRSRAETLADGLGLSHDARGTSTRAPSPTALAARLNGTILVYCLRPDNSYLWAFSPTQSAFYRLPARDTILSLLEKHRAAILASKDVLADPTSPGQLLYNLLITPAQNLIAPQGKVFVIADQGLHRLNFETLLTPGPKPHFFIEDAVITNAPSLSVLAARAPHPKPQSRNLLLIGDPVYAGGGRAELLNASSEVASIANQFPTTQRTVLTGSQALPSAYASSDPARFSYIHFVAHGTASERNPLDSSVILSPPSDHPEAYKLYASSILERHIHADLVTISTCYGSGSRAYAGEGLVGLAWAFLRAGSHNVIGSLWEISDASTPELMAHMYTHLGQGDAPDTALRSAKLTMLHSEGVFRKPIYWAPFQLYAGA